VSRSRPHAGPLTSGRARHVIVDPRLTRHQPRRWCSHCLEKGIRPDAAWTFHRLQSGASRPRQRPPGRWATTPQAGLRSTRTRAGPSRPSIQTIVAPPSGPTGQAELAKLVENTFPAREYRVMNELPLRHELGRDIWGAISAAATKAVRIHAVHPWPGGRRGTVFPSTRRTCPGGGAASGLGKKLTVSFRLANELNSQMTAYVVSRGWPAAVTVRGRPAGRGARPACSAGLQEDTGRRPGSPRRARSLSCWPGWGAQVRAATRTWRFPRGVGGTPAIPRRSDQDGNSPVPTPSALTDHDLPSISTRGSVGWRATARLPNRVSGTEHRAALI